MTARPPLFSTGITIKDFRGYGAFNLELPARPCVVVLSGPNGLGKTSLFEALEWALTGSVKRLDRISGGKANPRDLARHADAVDSFEVSLAFQDGKGSEERVTRTQLIPRTTAPLAPVGTPTAEVAEILSSGDPRWNVSGKNLADYLHLTHLHAQVAFLRLVTYEAKDRWMRVSPLAGADRFERVRTNLTNSKKELTRLKDRRAQELATAIATRQRWTDLRTRLQQLQKIAGTRHDVLSPAEVSKKVVDLRVSLGLDALTTTPSGAEADIGEASEQLRVLRVQIEDAIAETALHLESVGQYRSLPQQVADLRTQHLATVERAKVLATERDALKARASALEAAVKGPRTLYEDSLRKQQVAASRHELAVRAERDRGELPRFEAELADAEEQARAAQEKLEQLEVELRRRKEDFEARESRLRERDRTGEKLASVDRAIVALAELETLQKRLVEEEARREGIATGLQKLDRDMAAAASEGRAREEAAAVAAREIEILQQAFDTLQKALLAIADHLRDEDKHCPVCRTQFEHGVLRAVARDALGALDPQLVDADARLRAATAGHDEVRKQQTQRALEHRKAEADLRAVKDNIVQLQSRVGALRKDPLLVDRGLEEARLELSRLRITLLGDIGHFDRELAQAPDASDLKRAVLDATTASETQKRVSAIAQERRTGRQTRVEQLRARIAQVQTEHPELTGDAEMLALIVQARATEASNSTDAADEASLRVAEAQAADSAARQAIVAAESELAKIAALADSLVSTRDGLESRWRDAGLPEAITERNLDAEIDKLGHRRREMDGGLDAVGGFAAALDRWRQTDELQGAEADVRRECGSREHDTYARELDEAVAAATAAARVAQRAREASDSLSATLNKVTSEFGGRALRPFDELFRRYLRALIHDERFHTIEATYKPAARSAGLSFKVDLGGLNTEAEYILSEGQLGEVSLATMLAASSAFPWSRWRVLLLDDPTQYNDLIHSTALFDVLRNLVRFAGYQIFVSTHDNEQAAFIRRKLDAIETPWIDCRYIAHSPEGIVMDVRKSFDDSLGDIAAAR